MTPLDQEGLLLRQVAGLRRRGTSQHRALEIAAQGLPAGELRAATQAALRALKANEGLRGDPLDRLLADGNATADQFDAAAAAVEARLQARASLRVTRLHLGVALAGPLVLGSFLGWVVPYDALLGTSMDVAPSLAQPTGSPLPLATRGIVSLGALLRYAGVPMAVLAVFVVNRFADRFAPGFRQSLQAAALLDVDAPGGSSLAVKLRPADQRYLLARQGRVGTGAAGRELAAELLLEAKRSLLVFGHVAPIVGAILVFAVVALTLALLTLPVFALGGIA